MANTDGPDPGREVRADLRAASREMRELYVSLVREGFTNAEALQIIGITLTAAIGGQAGQGK
jgi:hypothetical protein